MKVIFNRDFGQLFLGGSILMHVGVGNHGVKSGKRDAVKSFIFLIGCCRQCIGGAVGAHIGHLFHSAYQNNIIQPGQDFNHTQTQRQSAGSTGRFYPGNSARILSQIVCQQRTEMFLPVKQSTGHAAHIHGINMVDASIVNGSQCGFHKQFTDRFSPMFAARGHTHA